MKKLLQRAGIKLVGRRTALRIHALFFREPRFIFYAMKRLLHRQPKVIWPQWVPTFDLQISLDPDRLADDLSAQSMCVHSGGHAVYIHRSDDIEKLCPGLSTRYPQPFGLKIFRSTSLAPDGTVYYTSMQRHPLITPLAMWTVGSVGEKVAVGNILGLRGVTPRVYDLIWFKNGDGRPLMAMVVEHAGHEVVYGDEGVRFMNHFRTISEEEGFAPLSEGFEHHNDFLPPNFSGNIILGESGPVYVDVQNFALRDPAAAIDKVVRRAIDVCHFGTSSLFRKQNYPYQSIPWLGVTGKRDVSLRTTKIETMLRAAGCELEGARVLDVGCNMGLFMAFFMWKGASWCIGMDKPEIVDAVQALLYFFGYSRFELIGADLRRSELWRDSLGEPVDVMLLLAMTHHIGFPAWIKQVDWKFLVFEGEGGEPLEHTRATIAQNFPEATVVAQEIYQDGESPPRPVVLLRHF